MEEQVIKNKIYILKYLNHLFYMNHQLLYYYCGWAQNGTYINSSDDKLVVSLLVEKAIYQDRHEILKKQSLQIN